ncbi:glycoside hydrolase 100 family protein [Geobacter sp.]|uniref:glycoside hydrolase 100 family protein n=1 Tax=Geobacter sp. TaxID=46610 RepID=UPI00262CD3A1|nr:glycoside hydrolase 100 family protein [Geobacter sp.]
MERHETELLTECRERSLELLRRNASPAGILAASRGERADRRDYTTVFSRDAAICTLGMAASGEPDLLALAAAGVRTLAAAQAGNGQIPNYVKPESGRVDFWYSGCIDATLWWLVALRTCTAAGVPELGGELAGAAERAIGWLRCQEHPVWGLVQQNEASDWADIMPRSGFVLYSNALWYAVKRLYRLPGAEITRDYANHLFFPFGPAVPEERRARLLMHYVRNRAARRDLYLSFVNFSLWGEEGDVLGNLLACLTGIADTSRTLAIVRVLRRHRIDDPYPARAVVAPIPEESPLWRLYMARHRQNHPWQYHNGGIWPMIGGFWALLLARLGLRDDARKAVASLARANAVRAWEFNEWFHGLDGEPRGMPGQSWNAAMFILAHRAVEGRVSVFG